MKHDIERGPVAERVSGNIRRLREAVGWDQTQLAAVVSKGGRRFTRNMVNGAELGRRRIDVDDLVALAEALGASPAELLGGPDWEYHQRILTASAGLMALAELMETDTRGSTL